MISGILGTRLGALGDMEMNEEKTVAAYLAESLPRYGVTHVFELVGGMITVMLDALHQNPKLTVVSMHHEQAAGFAAEGFTRTSNKPAVAMGTSGPGATNLLTAIASCYFDSIPVIFITGQVNTSEMRTKGKGRQGGFQETDIVSMCKPVTKEAFLITEPSDFPRMLEKAFEIAQSGRPGPVLIDIPMDIQRSVIIAHTSTTAEPKQNRTEKSDSDFLDLLHDALSKSEKPLIISGGGIRSANAGKLLELCVTAWGIPVVTSLLGIDSIPASHPQRVGFIGSYGNRWANHAIAESDLLLVLGSRLDIRQTGSDIPGFKGNRKIFHVDIDPGELNNHVTGSTATKEDLTSFLSAALERLHLDPCQWSDWRNEIAQYQEKWPDTNENISPDGINPNIAMRQICAAWEEIGAFVTDVGQHQMWAAQSVQLRQSQRFLTSGGMGSMGFGLPAAIGASMADPSNPVCLVAGDGGLQCNIQEFQTLVRLGLPIRIIVFDNGCHGMVRQFQESYFESRYYSTQWGYSAPDFQSIANAYGMPATSVTTHRELDAALMDPLFRRMSPSLIRVEIQPEINAYPKMAFGQPFGSMEPSVKSTDMEGT